MCVYVCVDWRHVCRLTKLKTRALGHKWRPGHRDIGNINDDRDTQRESDRDTNDDQDTGNINDDQDTQMMTGTTGKQQQRGRRGAQGECPWHNREYKWRRGHSKRKRPGHKECSISNQRQRETTTTGTPGGTGGYINDDGDTGNVRLAITINKAQGQSLE